MSRHSPAPALPDPPDTDDLPAHSDLGASSADRWLHCPGSYALSRAVPPRPTSVYAAAGTVAHGLVEAALRQMLDAGKTHIELRPTTPPEVVTVAGHEITVDETMIEGVQVMVDYVSEVLDLYSDIMLEQRVFLDDYFPADAPPPVRMFGRADVLLYAGDTKVLEVVDFKNGAGVAVHPQSNPQLLYYAAGAVAKLHNFYPVKYVRLTIVQPHILGQQKVRSVLLPVLDLMMWVEDTLIPGVRACEAWDAPLVLGRHCRFCPALHACPAHHALAVETAKQEFAPAAGIALAENLERCEILSYWIDAVRDHALAEIGKGEVVPGWTLEPTRPVRRWADPGPVGQLLTDKGLNPKLWVRNELKSPAQIEKALRKNHSSLWRTLEQFVKSESSGLKLARGEAPPDTSDTFLNP